ncbi:DddA-like double-stranded DNA deaminase toxin [Amycolatopsis keratiniphila]|uniref:DddA-like double-stranded DNA deaminase toxin n=1 Tax=Amycolatopsis keratiniphila TaxID=129921 RepID=UPI000879DEF1|nr:DddA-like double-stranded DNA deaminase toxin [Amycolatopsis keratiniphila]SDU67371.1 SCP1.201-like deaminase [Amycolatopsis keratiniphila]
MGLVQELASGVRTALAKMKAAGASLERAGQELEEAREKWSEVAVGVSDPDFTRLPSLSAEVQSSSESVSGLIGQSSDLLEGYLRDLGMPAESTSAGVSGQSAPPGPGSPSGDRDVDEEDDDALVERLQRELPPGPKPGIRGVKTQGQWFAPGKKAEPIASGLDDRTDRVDEILKESGCSMRPVTAAADVELKLAAEMRDSGITEASVVINNVPCTGKTSCDGLLGIVLPEGSKLTVHGTDGFKKTYEGGKTWQW